MKVLSDNTADRLLRHLDAAEGGATPRRIPRGASTTPPARMWQIHVTAGGAVTVDGGDVYANGTRHTLEPADLGTVTENSLVVWHAAANHNGDDEESEADETRDEGGTITLESASWTPADEIYRIIGEVSREDADSVWQSKQCVHGPIEVDLHFGNAEDAETRESWDLAEEVPAILEIPDSEGNPVVKVLVDSRGNVVSWGPDIVDPPPCGNPLNRDDDYNPLNTPVDHPLDHEGDGGFTPECFGEDNAA